MSKIELGLSESRILEMFRLMHADIPQATLNSWLHKVMRRLREALQEPTLKAIRGDTSYGTLAQCVARYILDDEQAFRMFLTGVS